MRLKRIEPGPGQESVWDYPRPPRIETVDGLVRVTHAGVEIASSRSSKRVLETSHPPVYYIPREDVNLAYLRPSARHSFCEWKGRADYVQVEVGERIVRDAGWVYPTPSTRAAVLRNHYAFYASKLDACWVDDEQAISQAGDFYGGWITSRIVGPFKGELGTDGW